jgi:flagellar M-ring protein FliF
VTAAAGISEARGDTVEVSAAAFPATAAVAVEEAPAVPENEMMDMIPTIAGAVALVIVALALVLMSRGGKKSGAIAASGTMEALPGGQAALMSPSSATDAVEMSGMASDVMQLVERQPEEIATLLRSWLADQRERV